MGTKIKLSNVRIRDVRPYGWAQKLAPNGRADSQGHEFEMAATLSFTKFLSTGKTRYFKDKDEESVLEWTDKLAGGNTYGWSALTNEMPTLEWGERIRWYSVSATGAWTFVAEDSVDMYEIAPRAVTFAGIYPAAFGFTGGWADPWTYVTGNPGMAATTTVAKPKGFDTASTDEQFILTAKHFRDKSRPLEIVTIDRPGLNKDDDGGPSVGGGGLQVHVKTGSRVRAIHFTLGFAGTGLQARATQILETQGGVPTMCKFITTGIDDNALEDTTNHARWRQHLSIGDYRARENWNFDF